MKITKRQLRRIIKEERQKFVNEISQSAISGDGLDRAEGMYFDVNLSDQFVNLASDLITNAMDSATKDGLDRRDAYHIVHAVLGKLMKNADSKARY